MPPHVSVRGSFMCFQPARRISSLGEKRAIQRTLCEINRVYRPMRHAAPGFELRAGKAVFRYNRIACSRNRAPRRVPYPQRHSYRARRGTPVYRFSPSAKLPPDMQPGGNQRSKKPHFSHSREMHFSQGKPAKAMRGVFPPCMAFGQSDTA